LDPWFRVAGANFDPLVFTELGSWFVLFSAAVLLAILFLKSRFSEARLLTIAMYGANRF